MINRLAGFACVASLHLKAVCAGAAEPMFLDSGWKDPPLVGLGQASLPAPSVPQPVQVTVGAGQYKCSTMSWAGTSMVFVR